MKQGEKRKKGPLEVLLLGGLLGILAFCFIIILIFPSLLNPFPGGSAQPDTPTPSIGFPSTSMPSPTPAPSSTPLPSFEVAEDTEIASTDKLGEINIEYPVRMSPRSSDSVLVSIYIPARLVSLMPIEIERIEIPADAPRIIGELNSHMTTILVTETMRVELSSPTFRVENLYPVKQKVDLNSIAEPTIWAWTIVAPDTVGTHVLTLRVYLGDNDGPDWVGNIKVEVAELNQPSSLVPLIVIAVMVVVVIGFVSSLALKGRFPISPFTRKEYLQRQMIRWNRRL